MIRALLKRLWGSELDRALNRARRHSRPRFLVFWNRGLGDIALGLCALFARIRCAVPAAHITVVTRAELAEAFHLTDVDHVVAASHLVRGDKKGFPHACAEAGIARGDFDVVLARPEPRKWLGAEASRFQPRLRWRSEYDRGAARFADLLSAGLLIGAHVSSETAHHYGYAKDWPVAHWRALFARIAAKYDARVVLFGHAREPLFDCGGVVDLRGKTTLVEMLAVIKNHCRILIGPDSGVLTMAYYLDCAFPATLISLWADPRQGILKQGGPPANALLRHVPLLGDGEDVTRIAVDEVFAAVEEALCAPSA